MDISQATLQAPETLGVPHGLARRVFEQTGVAVFFFGTDGVSMTSDEAGGDRALQESLAALAPDAAAQGADVVIVDPSSVTAAWPIRQRRRTIMVAAARVEARSEEGRSMARRLLAAAAEAVRAGFDNAAAKAENHAAAESLLQSYEEVSLLHHLGEVLRVNRPVSAILEQVCGELLQTVGADAAAAYLPGAEGVASESIIAGRLPFRAEDLPQVVAHLLDLMGTDGPSAGISGSVIVNNHCQDDPVLSGVSIALDRIVMVPLTDGQGRRGALLAANREDLEFGSPDAKLIRSAASATSIFIENQRLFRELQELMLDLVRSLVSSVDAKDPYTCGHSERVAITCRCLAEAIGLSPDEVQTVYMAGLLHDIGKIGTPEQILRKEGRLEPEERLVIQRHPVIGGRILAGIGKLDSIRDAVLYHHERIDGNGYPSGLKGDQVPLLARIVGLADAFDAMTSNRPYRPMLPLDEVRREIERNSGTQFDENLAKVFLNLDLHQLMRQFVERPTTVCI
jgi:putative nucleotidyltransferase with HDIG domain